MQPLRHVHVHVGCYMRSHKTPSTRSSRDDPFAGAITFHLRMIAWRGWDQSSCRHGLDCIHLLSGQWQVGHCDL
jgi:hypothetical protein